jgi:hypothetical protein
VKKLNNTLRTVRDKSHRNLLHWSIAVFVVKIIIISNISPDGIWPGADASNYARAAEALLIEGIFSTYEFLSYWPAGYPLFILLLSVFGESLVGTTISLFQTAIFSFSVYYFAKQLLKTEMQKYTKLIYLLILLNPTLSLSSISLGYESLAASGSLIVVGIILKDLILKKDETFLVNLMVASAILGFIIFLQPRFVVASLFVLGFWVYLRRSKKLIALFTIMSLMILIFFPATLVYRNHKATGVIAVSTNLGVTMNIGAGYGATGGYDSKIQGVDCNITTSDIALADRQRIACVLNWYISNPNQALKLFLNKSIYFWSPWSGPVLSGTMGLNPWLKINPITKISKSPEGSKLIASNFGKIISYLWIFSGLFLLFYGFFILWHLSKLAKIAGILALAIVASSWAVTLFSIGDHRFRVPIMCMSLFLQAVGAQSLWGKVINLRRDHVI